MHYPVGGGILLNMSELKRDMPKLKDLLVPMRLPHEDEVVTSEYKPFPPEVRKELEAKIARSVAQVIDLRRLI